jgi:hypothetical protein
MKRDKLSYLFLGYPGPQGGGWESDNSVYARIKQVKNKAIKYSVPVERNE